ncbi:hypothetical protein [Microbispora sp. KK1-11]|uniref:hypothetical protein n=1 Tax=Microbispora sp. KK1-11 TaxID=2053005 RepID=UPI00115A6BDE|nr:hypothetical protein [Microbispora sp. KK1-11]TQS29110.1 hypothetical protein FLW16_12250 [Microbispora sp. KK1-11]
MAQIEDRPSGDGEVPEDASDREQSTLPGEDSVRLDAAVDPLREYMRRTLEPHTNALSQALAAAWRPHAEQISQIVTETLLPRVEGYYQERLRLLADAWRPAFSRLWEQMAPAMADLQRWIEEQLPPNWQDADIEYGKIEEIVSRDSIPLVWVPRADIISAIMKVDSRDERVAILVDRGAEIAEDCLAVLDEIHQEDLLTRADFARKAIAAWRDGHIEAAQVLAACVTEALVTRYIGKPSDAVEHATIDWGELSLRRLKWAAAIGPLLQFYARWWPDKGEPPLTTLSRHVSVHAPSAQQCTPENCTIAVMLLTSLLRTMQEMLHEQQRREKEHADH